MSITWKLTNSAQSLYNDVWASKDLVQPEYFGRSLAHVPVQNNAKAAAWGKVHAQAAFHMGTSWAPVGPQLGQVVGPFGNAAWVVRLGNTPHTR